MKTRRILIDFINYQVKNDMLKDELTIGYEVAETYMEENKIDVEDELSFSEHPFYLNFDTPLRKRLREIYGDMTVISFLGKMKINKDIKITNFNKMIFTKETFTETINALHEQYKYDVAKASALENALGVEEMPTHDNSRLTNQLFKLLHQDFPPQNNICKIQEFAYDNNFGELSEQTISELWDELQDDIFVFPNDL